MSHGVGTEYCLRDYFRMHHAAARPAIDALVESGELLPVHVEGWGRPAYLHRDATVPRRVHARAVLSPFDPLVWDRRRFEIFWGWAYRFEAYTPIAKRRFGYYALPMLWRDEVIVWGNLSIADGALRADFGYVSGAPPRDRAFARELEAEVERLRNALIDHPDAMDLDPLLVRRLRRARADRRRRRHVPGELRLPGRRPARPGGPTGVRRGRTEPDGRPAGGVRRGAGRAGARLRPLLESEAGMIGRRAMKARSDGVPYCPKRNHVMPRMPVQPTAASPNPIAISPATPPSPPA